MPHIEFHPYIGYQIIHFHWSNTTPGAEPCPAGKGPPSHRPWYDLGMTWDPILNQTLLFYMSMTWSGQADVGECLETASRINSSDPNSWAEEWTTTFQ